MTATPSDVQYDTFINKSWISVNNPGWCHSHDYCRHTPIVCRHIEIILSRRYHHYYTKCRHLSRGNGIFCFPDIKSIVYVQSCLKIAVAAWQRLLLDRCHFFRSSVLLSKNTIMMSFCTNTENLVCAIIQFSLSKKIFFQNLLTREFICGNMIISKCYI